MMAMLWAADYVRKEDLRTGPETLKGQGKRNLGRFRNGRACKR